jgi:adenylate cyclase class 1
MSEEVRGDVVTAWLAAREAPEALPTPPPDALAPLALPAEADDPLRRDGAAEAWFREAEESAQRLGAADERYRDLFDVVRRNLLRYLAFSRRRLADLLSALGDRERQTFIALPFLLHVNDPGVPGYVSGAPHGVQPFEAHPALRRAVALLFGEGAWPTSGQRTRPVIRSVLAVGDAGTLAGPADAPLEVCVVVDEAALDAAARALLRRKLDAVAAWAQQRGVAVRLTPLDAARVRFNDFAPVGAPGPADGPPARLLKESLYRTALVLAGQVPLWWVAPVGVTSAEYRRLAEVVGPAGDRALGFVDLGVIGTLMRGELLRAVLLGLAQARLDPFGGLLQLAVLARYLDEDPPRLLCDLLKRRVFDADEAVPADPSVLLFEAVAEHLAARRDWTAFPLVQRCFYLKVGLKLSRENPDPQRFFERLRLMRAFVCRWGWTPDLLADLDAIDAWSGERLEALGQAVRTFLTGLYRRLVERARAEGVPVSDEDVEIAGRRLYAFFAPEPGKIRPLFNWFLREPRVEERLAVLEVPSAPAHRRWEVHRQLRTGQAVTYQDAIGAGGTLAEVAAWLARNRVFGPHTLVGLVGRGSRATLVDFRSLLARLARTLAGPDPFALPGAALAAPRHVRRYALIVNFEGDDVREASEPAGAFYLPENWDVLNYGRLRESRVRDATLVLLDSWGEVFCLPHTGDTALPDAFATLFRRLAGGPPPVDPPEIIVPQGRDMQPLRTRLAALLDQIERVCVRPGADRAFACEVGSRFQAFVRRDGRTRLITTDRLATTLRAFSRLGAAPQALELDPLSPSLRAVAAFLGRHATDREADVYVGWSVERDRGTLLVHDELGRLLCQTVPADRLERTLGRTVRRIACHLRTRATTGLELRRRLRVCEIRGARSPAEPVQVIDDTARVLAQVAETPRARAEELWVRGDLGAGRDGVYLQLGAERFSPRQHGRAFVLRLVRRLLETHTVYEDDAFRIDASDVHFGPAYARNGADLGVVKHLRLIALYERWIRSAIKAFRGARRRSLRTTGGFRRGGAP